MNQLIWIRLGIDAAMLLSLGYCGMRLLKSQGAHLRTEKLLELETSLRRVITDAQGAGTALNQGLLKRQRDMERLLFDIEGAEQRINRTINTAEDRKSALELELRRVDRVQEHPLPTAARPAASEGVTIRATTESAASESRHREPPPTPKVERTLPAERVNIYGEPIAATEPPQRSAATSAAPSALRNRIEKFSQPRSRDRLYEIAEKMLRAGIPVDEVAEQTGLPLDELQVLDRVVAREAAPEVPPMRAGTADPRLGVLSPVYREVRTV